MKILNVKRHAKNIFENVLRVNVYVEAKFEATCIF